jgi:hypothetical protein
MEQAPSSSPCSGFSPAQTPAAETECGDAITPEAEVGSAGYILPDGWSAHDVNDGSGNIYYYDSLSGTSTWHPPGLGPTTIDKETLQRSCVLGEHAAQP